MEVLWTASSVWPDTLTRCRMRWPVLLAKCHSGLLKNSITVSLSSVFPGPAISFLYAHCSVGMPLHDTPVSTKPTSYNPKGR